MVIGHQGGGVDCMEEVVGEVEPVGCVRRLSNPLVEMLEEYVELTIDHVLLSS